ncbi:MAG: UDP-2,3-diacylglucosamine diphosphatase [Candidatus Lindowbacteria bacterium]|nr:UDP-2,3-diacylglucosamine diphosphatase [Candidatus Lindowbacteria bacterium]
MERKRILFISDSHLGSGSNEHEKERTLIEFLNGLSPETVSTLYILGDLFDFWFEYGTVIFAKHFRVLTALAQAVERGIEIHLIVGNHDFWAGDFLRKTIGIKVHYEPILVNIEGLRVFMCHGDGVNPYDRGYLVLRAIIRSKPAVWAARMIHPDFVMWLARMFSKLSREGSTVAGKLREDDGLRQFALRKLHEDIDVVVAGHSHQPHAEVHSINGTNKRYYNSGDMQEHFTYVEYSGSKFQLKRLK